MAAIETAALDMRHSCAELWSAAARQAGAWLAARGLNRRDSIVLLPYAALLPLARQAFAALGGWQPRIETALTLSVSLGPPSAVVPGAVTGDVVQDRLAATRLLLRQPWGQAWARRDRRGFELLVASVVEAAQDLRRAALAQPPRDREAFWALAQQSALPTSGPGAVESLLLNVAMQWAALSNSAATDGLYDLRPEAWIVVRIGGVDDIAEAVLASAVCPSLRLDADPPADEPFAAMAHSPAPRRWVCDGIEAEAQAAAAEIIEALNQGRLPVALVALDRVLLRRIRTLLARQAVSVADETGWRLSTTRTAAQLMALLRAADSASGPDAGLEWLKTLPLDAQATRWLVVLEALWRGSRRLPAQAEVDAATHWWATQSESLQPLGDGRERSLAEWLTLLEQAQWVWAGAAESAPLLRALRIGSADADADAAWLGLARGVRLDLAGLTAWVDAVLDATNFDPEPAAQAQVVFTPLARAVGRPFAHVVVPGADHLHLGGTQPQLALISESMAKRLGLDHALHRQQRERLAFAQLLRSPRLTLLRRRADGADPVAASPLVEWLVLSRRMAGAPPCDEVAWVGQQSSVLRVAQVRPLPGAPDALPQTLSASTVEALRQCPYRFFARAVLRLEEPAEIEAPLVKRDYGNWLHEALHRFHRDRAGPSSDDLARLHDAASQATVVLRLDGAELLPFQASFETFAPAYVAWLQARESRGWRWQSGETDFAAAPPLMAPQTWRGRIDRIDLGPAGAIQVIDYKTGSAVGLNKRVKTPLEDTQLTFYAALAMAAQPESTALSALYLSLDDAKAPLEIPHPDVAHTAQTMTLGLAGEFARLRQGAAMPALGEGRVCDTCEARGLCRRDHWSELPSLSA